MATGDAERQKPPVDRKQAAIGCLLLTLPVLLGLGLVRARCSAAEEAREQVAQVALEKRRSEEQAARAANEAAEEAKRKHLDEVRRELLQAEKNNARLFLLAMDPAAKEFIASAAPSEKEPLVLVVGVTAQWLVLPREARRSTAIMIWNIWAKLNEGVVAVRITLRDPAGRRVGGSSYLEPSKITIEED
jgi:hypothetical protein